MEIKEYYKKIKDLQLNGTLNVIREEIRLHDKEEFEKKRHDSNYKLVCVHFIDRLMIALDAPLELIEQINYCHWELSVHDKEFGESKEKYENHVKSIEASEFKESLVKATSNVDKDQLNKRVTEVEELIKKFFK